MGINLSSMLEEQKYETCIWYWRCTVLHLTIKMKICLAFCYFVCLPQPLLILQTFMLPDNPDDIILRAITISANVLSSLGNYSQVQTSDK